jgi:uncharacterized protein
VPFPSVYNEVKDFARHNNCNVAVMSKVDTWLVKKTPDRYKVTIPSKIFYEYVDYMRSRINKGMNVAEEAIWESVSRCTTMSESGQSLREMKEEIERETVGSVVRKFRVLLLARELDAAVVSQDLGIQRWSEQLGLRFMESRSFPVMIKEYMGALDQGGAPVEEFEEGRMI